MTFLPAAATIIIGLSLVYACFTDIRERVISNTTVLIVTLAAAAHLLWQYHVGTIPFSQVAGAAALAVGILAVGVLAVESGQIGGGDVKLLAGLSLLTGLAYAVELLIATGLAGGLLSIGMMMVRRGANTPPVYVPYGFAISVGGFWIIARIWGFI